MMDDAQQAENNENNACAFVWSRWIGLDGDREEGEEELGAISRSKKQQQ
jgi:hypothetical protein